MKKSNNQGFGHFEIVALVVVVALAGAVFLRVNNANDSTQRNASADEKNEVSTVEALPNDLSDIKTFEEIQLLAEGDAADLRVLGIELEVEDGRTVYVVHLSDGTIVAYDASSGERVQLVDDNDDSIDEDDGIPQGFVATTTLQDAMAIAKKQRPNSTVKKVELEVENGIVVYSIRFTDDSRVDVSAVDGTIVRTKDEDGVDSRANDSSDDSSDGDDSSSSDAVGEERDHDDDDDHESDDIEDRDEKEEDDHSDNSGSGSSSSGSGS